MACRTSAESRTSPERQSDRAGSRTGRDFGGGDAARLHVEPSAAIVGLDDDAARYLGRRYGQDAIFAWDPAAWRLLSCTDDRTETCGWTSTDGDALSMGP
ncbi:DUF3293 domain-containing protein [Sphaerimonospora thailandensis]|uniref:Uncharacterized protein n=1 Tax=Sphaerimonospora thailandensis TaxID=795644 RepID=A0A8J3RBG1_9ACTN|nr:hypothetical protein Mth01_34940 [Sphaerimonospora thailandensis]